MAGELYHGVVFYHLGIDAHKEPIDIMVAN